MVWSYLLMELQVDDGQVRWHGLTDDEWLTLLESYHWKDRVVQTLLDALVHPDTSTEDRLQAMLVYSEGMKAQILPSDQAVPGFLCDVLLRVTEGKFRIPWWRRFGLARRRSVIASRIAGARQLMLTAAQCLASRQFRDILSTPKTEGLAS